jgi:hypothetical protein
MHPWQRRGIKNVDISPHAEAVQCKQSAPKPTQLILIFTRRHLFGAAQRIIRLLHQWRPARSQLIQQDISQPKDNLGVAW